ncbi:MAG: sigma-70 family RNA polymerase sigma factor [Saprospiraceae bacterium]|nr:sigma-70 family RNA polymerase sigma factor [Saprospiraceae bacterium]
MSEAEIIRDCIKGDSSAQELLYKRYASKMLGVCIRYFKSIEEAEDALQEGFIKVFSNLKNFRSEGSFEGWIRKIMVNTALNNYRSNQKHYFHTDIEEIQEQFSGDSMFNENYSCEQLLKMIQDLPTGYRLVFNLFEIEGYSHKEIAEMLNISTNTSKSQLLKARNVLKNKLINTNHH